MNISLDLTYLPLSNYKVDCVISCCSIDVLNNVVEVKIVVNHTVEINNVVNHVMESDFHVVSHGNAQWTVVPCMGRALGPSPTRPTARGPGLYIILWAGPGPTYCGPGPGLG